MSQRTSTCTENDSGNGCDGRSPIHELRRKPLQRRPDKAKVLWQSIFACPNSHGSEEDMQQALKLLFQEPRLALTPFKEVDQAGFLVKRLFPLHSLLIVLPRLFKGEPQTQNTSFILSMLQQIHDLHKSAIRMELVYNGFRGLSLDYACSHYGGANPCLLKVVEWLTITHPQALVMPNHVGLFPIHRAFQSKQTLERIHWPTHKLFQILLPKAPQTILQRDQHPYYHMNPLEWAFHLEYDVHTQEYLILQYLKQLHNGVPSTNSNLVQPSQSDTNQFRLDVSVGDDRSFDSKQAAMVAKVIPHIHGRMDVICSKKMCVEGFTDLLLQYLANNTTITTLSILRISNEYINYYVQVWNALQTFLTSNTTVQEMAVSARRHVYGAEVSIMNRPSFLNSIAQGIHENCGSLKTLTLQQMEIPSQRLFCSLVNQNVSLQKLTLENVRMDFLWNHNKCYGYGDNDKIKNEPIDKDDKIHTYSNNNQSLSSKTLESLTVKFVADKYKSKSIFDGLLRHLAVMPMLKELSLVVNVETHSDHRFQDDIDVPENDITAPLAALLRQNRLENLALFVWKRKSFLRPRSPPSEIANTGAHDTGSTGSSCPMSIDLSFLCETGLTNNTSLRIFDCNIVQVAANADDDTDFPAITSLLTTLERHNTTLTSVPITHWGIPEAATANSAKVERIAYWLQLNQHGRANARDAVAGLDAFVDLLCGQLNEYHNCYEPYMYAAQEDGNNGISCSSDSQLDLFNVVYGLLRELPSMWT